MKFLLDQDVFMITAHFLQKLGHDVVRVAEIGYSKAEDEELLKMAQENERIFVTRDRDFGALVFVKNLGTGVLYLRILPSTLETTHEELEKVLKAYSEEELRKAFVVIEPGRHRIRRFLQK